MHRHCVWCTGTVFLLHSDAQAPSLLHRRCVFAAQALYLLHRRRVFAAHTCIYKHMHSIRCTCSVFLVHGHCICYAGTAFLMRRHCVYCTGIMFLLHRHHICCTTQNSFQRSCSKTLFKESVLCDTALYVTQLCSLYYVHGYAQVHTSIYIYIYIYPIRFA